MRVCGRCGEQRDDSEFTVRDKRTGRRHTLCLPCRRYHWRAYHHRDRDRFNQRRKARVAGYRARNRTFLAAYLRSHPCVDCGLFDPIVMEFDHVRGTKTIDVSLLISNCAPIAKILAEIEKCEVRCANCHRRKTARDFWHKGGPSRN